MARSVLRSFAFLVSLSACSSLFAGPMVKIISVVNGNTLRVDLRGKETDVRLLGVATPDPKDDARPILKRLGIEAMSFLKETTKSGWVMLEFPTGQPVADSTGVVDASVYGGTDASFINEKLIAQGFGVVNRKVECAFRDQLVKSENVARAGHRGIWGSFESGSGEAVASGRSHQETYIGELAQRNTPNYVTLWVIYYR